MDTASSAFAHHIGVLRRRGWIIVFLALLAAGVSLAVTLTSEPVYRASMKVVVGQGGGVFQPAFGSSVQPFTQTMTNLLKSNVVAQAAVDRTGGPETAENVLDSLGVTSAPDSSVLEVTYDSPDGARAVQMLAVIGDEFTKLVGRSLGAQRTDAEPSTNPPVTATVFDPPHLLAGQVSPQPVRDAVLAGLLGAAIGVILAFGLEALDDRLRSRRDAEVWFGARVIGTLSKRILRLGSEDAIAALAGPGRRREDALAMDVLVANTSMLASSVTTPVIGVTSARHGEGKSLVACAVAQGLASSGRRVVLVDADILRPSVASYFAVDAGPSLLDVIRSGIPARQALLPARLPDVTPANPVMALVARHAPEQAQGRIAEPLRDLFSHLRGLCDIVVVDMPPALTSADSMALMSSLDGVIIVARHAVTRRGDAEAVHELTSGIRPEALAVVITESDARPRLALAASRGTPTEVMGLDPAVDPSRR